MHRVLVTGASGFLGRHCLDQLAGPYEVHALTKSTEPEARSNLHIHRIDLFDSKRLAVLLAEIRPSHLLHLAWITAPASYRDSADNLNWLSASALLLRAFAENGGQRVVTAGSCAEYDWDDGICDEASTPLRPTSLYGICKNALRESQEAYARQAGFSAAWGRIFFPYGPGEHPERFVSYVIRSLWAGQPALCSMGTQRRDYIYVKDAARALVALLFSSTSGAVNIGTGEAVEVAEIAADIGRLMDRPELIRIGARATIVPEVPEVVAAQRRLRGELGWAPAFSLETGLRESIHWWKQQLFTA